MRALLFLLFGVLLSCGPEKGQKAKSTVMGVRQQITHVAGEQVLMKFSADEGDIPLLLVSSALGSTTIKGKKTAEEWQYEWPSTLTQKAGVASWVLLKSRGSLPNGSVRISPYPGRRGLIETYLGPKSIRVGGTDYTMLAALPTDPYDNLLPEGSPLGISRQIGENLVTDTMVIRNGMVWKNLFSPDTVGIMLASLAFGNSESKELSVKVRPGNATDFELDLERIHSYADGHQLLTIRTSRISDQYGNTISDGTLVNFVAQTSLGATVYAMGKTLSGIATAKFLHPERPGTWKITAYITGVAESTSLALEFKAAFSDFKISVSENDRILSMGPIRSFMDQLIPDGMGIRMIIKDTHGKIQKLQTTTRNGKGEMILDPEMFAPGIYEAEIETGGVLKKITLNLKDDQME